MDERVEEVFAREMKKHELMLAAEAFRLYKLNNPDKQSWKKRYVEEDEIDPKLKGKQIYLW